MQYDAINNIADQYHIDHRFILAEVLTESSGCVRVPTTGGEATGIWNPGLLQDYDGYYTCNCETYNGVSNQVSRRILVVIALWSMTNNPIVWQDLRRRRSMPNGHHPEHDS